MGGKKDKKPAKKAGKAPTAPTATATTDDGPVVPRRLPPKPIITNVSVAFAAPPADRFVRSVVAEQLTITFHGAELLTDASLKLHAGNRYGLLGPNGCGKTTLMKCIAAGEITIPHCLTLFFVEKEVDSTPLSALEAVLSVDVEKENLEEEAAELQVDESPEAEERLAEIYARLDEIEASSPEARAGRILAGLGFNKEMQAKACKDYSGGWRMRIALAQGLFMNPSLLLLDEPSNHLDIEAVVWLEEYLKNYNGILLVISHSQDFLNNVCTNVIRMHNRKLQYFKGNYDQYIKTRIELEENQMKRYQWEQDQIKHMKDYIARFGHGSAKLARQAQSKEKTLAKMERGGLTDVVKVDRALSFHFPDPGKLAGTIIQFQDVSFGYPGGKQLYHKLDLGVDLDSRIALVGPNGAGKTTLQKLMMGVLEPTEGMISRNGHLRIARFAQHFVDQLPFDLTPLEFMQREFPELQDIQQVRSVVGRFGLSGKAQLQKIGTLSEGQKARCSFAHISRKSPHMLMLDEPTNALDIETIDALADAINAFEGGMVLVSHDIRLISQVADEIWICEGGNITRFTGDIGEYKEVIRKKIQEFGEAYSKVDVVRK